jgi:hypothetical protein
LYVYEFGFWTPHAILPASKGKGAFCIVHISLREEILKLNSYSTVVNFELLADFFAQSGGKFAVLQVKAFDPSKIEF